MPQTKITIANISLSKIGAKNITALYPTENTVESRAVNAVYDYVRDSVLTEHPWTFAQKRATMTQTITAATTANPVLITCANSYTNGNTIMIRNVVGMTQLNGNTYLVANRTPTQFTLQTVAGVDVDGTGYTAYASAGDVFKVVAPTWTDDWVKYVYTLPTDFLKLNFTSDASALIRLEGGSMLSDTAFLKILYTYSCDDPTLYFPKFVEALACKLAHELCFKITESRNKAADLLTEYQEVVLPAACASDSQQGSAVEPMADEWLNARLAGSTPFPYQQPGRATWYPY